MRTRYLILLIALFLPVEAWAGMLPRPIPQWAPFNSGASTVTTYTPAPSWTPASATTDGGLLPVHWYKATGNYQDSSGVTPAVSDGDVIGKLADLGSVVSGVSQPATANKPTLQLAELNGQAVIRFDGSNDWLQGPFAATVSQPYVIYAVAKMDATVIADGQYRFMIDGGDATDRAILYKINTNAWSINAGAVLSGSAADANWNIWAAVFNGASAQFWHSGVSEAAGNAGAQAIDGLTLGDAEDFGKAWKGDVAEVIIYSGNPSTADKNQLGQYLGTRYGITYTDIP